MLHAYRRNNKIRSIGIQKAAHDNVCGFFNVCKILPPKPLADVFRRLTLTDDDDVAVFGDNLDWA